MSHPQIFEGVTHIASDGVRASVSCTIPINSTVRIEPPSPRPDYLQKEFDFNPRMLKDVIDDVRASPSELQGAKHPPILPLVPAAALPTATVEAGEQQVASGKFGKGMSYRLLASGGEIGAKGLGRIINVLEAYKIAVDDEEE